MKTAVVKKDEAEKHSGIKGVLDLFPDKVTSGKVVISQYDFSDAKDPLYNLRQMRDGYWFMRMVNGRYVRMHIDGNLVMSDTLMERSTNSKFITAANGEVLIAGLGLGIIVRNIIDKPEVTSITVIEKNIDVIKLVAPKFNGRINIVCADILKWMPKNGKKYDCIYFDIWQDINTDNLAEIKLLHNKFKSRVNRKNEKHFMDSWMKQFLQSQKRKEGRW